MNTNTKIIRDLNDIEDLKQEFYLKHKVSINNFLDSYFIETLIKSLLIEKNWTLATGIDNIKYEKAHIPQNDKINNSQIKNVNNAFALDRFSYIFYRSMNANKTQKMSFFEFSLRHTLSSNEFIDKLNIITGLNLTKLTTLFLSKYKSGCFLSPHSDKGNGKLAFVIHLSKHWKPQYGGLLHFMNDERTQIIDTLVPSFNTLMLFNIPEQNGIPHFVSHVVPNIKHSRYAITGWFE